MSGSDARGKSARQKGKERKRRNHRAWRRDATQQQRELTNKVMRAKGHPGWVTPEPEPYPYYSTRWADLSD